MKRASGVLVLIFCFAFIVAFFTETSQKTVQAAKINTPAIDDSVVSSNENAIQPLNGTRDWTTEEIAAARPFPVPEVSNRPEMTGPDPAFLEQLSIRSPGKIQAQLPDDVIGIQDASGLDFNPGTLIAGYIYPAPFSRFIDNNVYKREFPAKTIGKLYFWQYGVPYVCSAASIGNSAIWTAGHCVHSGDGTESGWSYNAVFIPAYENGKKPLGQYRVINFWVMNEWKNNNDYAHDMGGAVVTLFKKKTLSQRVGALGFAWNQPLPKHWFEIGYPAEYPFDGNKQVVCAASYAYSDPNFTPQTIGIGCDQTAGTSGGPWLLNYNNGNYLNGNMSYRYTGNSFEIFSPYYDDGAYNLYNLLISQNP